MSRPEQPAPVFVVDDLGRGLAASVLAQLLAYPQRPLDAQVLATALPDAELVGLFPPEAQRQLPAWCGITVGSAAAS